MRAGWSIDGVDECLKNGDVEVPLNYQNQSLVVQGSVRMILEPSQVRMLVVKLNDELKKTAEEGFGWKKMEGFWLGVHHSHRYQSPQFIPELRQQSESMCRSTLVRRGGGSQWELVEMAEPLMRLLDQEDEIEELQGREGKVLTFVAEDGVAPEQFGFELEEEHRLPRPGPEVFDDLAILESLDVAKHSGLNIHSFYDFYVFNMFLIMFKQSGVFWFMIFL